MNRSVKYRTGVLYRTNYPVAVNMRNNYSCPSSFTVRKWSNLFLFPPPLTTTKSSPLPPYVSGHDALCQSTQRFNWPTLLLHHVLIQHFLPQVGFIGIPFRQQATAGANTCGSVQSLSVEVAWLHGCDKLLNLQYIVKPSVC